MIAFETRLAEHAASTDAHLSELLRQPDGVPERLRDAMRHAVLGGGKRFRPFLVLESAALFGVPPDEARQTAAALECLHCYSLVHDDLPAMDNDELRRGQPTVWAAFDDWTAILAGDALLTLSFEMLAHESCHEDALVRSKLVQELARAAGPAGMVGGQAIDLMSDKLGQPAAPSLDYVRTLQSMKTGALIRFACEAGAILGRSSPAEQSALRSYGEYLGVVFQIADDLLDATGDPATVGKATGKDTEAGKATQVSLIGIDSAREVLSDTKERALSALQPFGARAGMLQAAVRFAAERVQ